MVLYGIAKTGGGYIDGIRAWSHAVSRSYGESASWGEDTKHPAGNDLSAHYRYSGRNILPSSRAGRSAVLRPDAVRQGNRHATPAARRAQLRTLPIDPMMSVIAILQQQSVRIDARVCFNIRRTNEEMFCKYHNRVRST